MKTLYVTCVAGWGNRLSPLVSAIRFSKLFNCKLKVIWSIDEIFPCDFYDVFHEIEMDNVEIIYDYNIIRRLEERYCETLRFFKSQCDVPGFFDGFDDSDEDCVISSYKFLVTKEEMDRYNPKGYCDLPPAAVKDFRYYHSLLRPREDIQAKIDEMNRRIDKEIIGVHLRKPEVTRQPGEVPPFKWRPDKDIYQMMQVAIDRNSDQRFFLSSDCKPTENRFVKKFGDKIITSRKQHRVFVWNYDEKFRKVNFITTSKESIKEAFVDLICLSKTGYIIRNLQSTFSSYAGVIGNVPSNTY